MATAPEVRSGERRSGFTLIELLVIIAIISTFAVLFFSGLSGTGKSTGLQAAQATLTNAVAAARTKAMMSGHNTRLLINDDSSDPTRYRRMIAVVEAVTPTNWVTRSTLQLPEGAYVVPYKSRILTGMFPDPSLWTRYQGTDPLASSVLSDSPMSLAVDSPVVESWEYIQFTAYGTTSSNGNLVLAEGRTLPPAEIEADGSPIVMVSPDHVRGFSLSSYGLARPVGDRTGF